MFFLVDEDTNTNFTGIKEAFLVFISDKLFG